MRSEICERSEGSTTQRSKTTVRAHYSCTPHTPEGLHCCGCHLNRQEWELDRDRHTHECMCVSQRERERRRREYSRCCLYSPSCLMIRCSSAWEVQPRNTDRDMNNGRCQGGGGGGGENRFTLGPKSRQQRRSANVGDVTALRGHLAKEPFGKSTNQIFILAPFPAAAEISGRTQKNDHNANWLLYVYRRAAPKFYGELQGILCTRRLAALSAEDFDARTWINV